MPSSSESIEQCSSSLQDLLTLVNRLILNIQGLVSAPASSLSSSGNTIFIAKRDPVLVNPRKRFEFWHLCINSVQVIPNTSGSSAASAEITITGSGIHGLQDKQDMTSPVLAADYMDEWEGLCFIEAGSHKVTINPRDQIIVNGCPLTAKNVVGLNTVKFEDDPDLMGNAVYNDVQLGLCNLPEFENIVNYHFSL